MQVNKFYIAIGPNGEPGLRCDCGNTEYQTEAKGSYDTFSYWRNTATGAFEGCCLRCNSQVQPISQLRGS